MAKLDSEQRKIVRLIKREGQNIRDPHLRQVYLRAAVQTGLVESGLRNLNYGDADSKGWRQERASLYPNPTNLRASIRRFREEVEQQYDPGEKSYEVAAQVQRPREDLRGRYHDVARQAAGILRGTGSPGGPGGSMPGGSNGPTYRTVPGVDNSATRDELKRAYFADSHNPQALLQLKVGLDEAQDVPSRRVRVRGSRPSSSPSRPSRAGGRKGLPAAVNLVDSLVNQAGALITAKQEPGHTAGGDHDPAVKGATARDIGGDERTRERIFRRLMRELGVKGAVYKGPDVNVVKGGVRYQVISRDHGTGPHLHVGMRRV